MRTWTVLRFVRSFRVLLLGTLAGCPGPDDPEVADATTGSGPGDSSASASSTDSGTEPTGVDPDTGTGSSSETESDPASLEECIAESAIDVECGGDEPAFAYVAFHEQLGCSGTQGASDQQALMLTSLDMTPEGGEPPVLGLRLAASPAPLPGDQVELTLPAPVPYSMLDPTMTGVAVMMPGLPLVFDAATGDGTVELVEVPPLEDLLDGGQQLEGTFELGAALVTVEGTPSDHPAFEMRGCFRLPADLHPIELD